jgi:hypothetical protein
LAFPNELPLSNRELDQGPTHPESEVDLVGSFDPPWKTAAADLSRTKDHGFYRSHDRRRLGWLLTSTSREKNRDRQRCNESG